MVKARSQKKVFLWSLVGIEVLTVALLIGRIINGRIFTFPSVTPISKSGIVYPQGSELKYFYEPKPFAGSELSGNWRALVSKEPQYTINADSLNERFDYQVPKPGNVFRIIILGDSFTFGHYVDTKSNYTELLEDKLQTFTCRNKKFEVLNLGVPGYDIAYSVERFQRRAPKYQPDLVLWFLKNDDFEQPNEILTPLVNKLKDGLTSRGVPSTMANTQAWQEAVGKLDQEFGPSVVDDYNAGALRELDKYYSGELLIFSYPNALNNRNRKILNSFKRGRDQTELNFDLRNINQKDLFLADGHPSESGHASIASDLFDYLTSTREFGAC